jgi:hypothetical protein
MCRDCPMQRNVLPRFRRSLCADALPCSTHVAIVGVVVLLTTAAFASPPSSAIAQPIKAKSIKAKSIKAKSTQTTRKKANVKPATTRTSGTPNGVAPTTVRSSGVGSYPAQSEWLPGPLDDQPLPATGGTPLIKQIRNGAVIATYTKLGGAGCTSPADAIDAPDPTCGAFSRSPHSNKRDGDIFEVYPAIYEGVDQQPYIGPSFDNYPSYQSGTERDTVNVTIRGVTVNGRRPVLRVGAGGSNNTLGQALVYVDKSRNITIENIDIDGGGAGTVGKSGIYLYRTNGVTLRNMRIHGFRRGRTNGVFAAGSNRGTFTMERVQLFDNGGDSGPEHNVYINASDVDPNWTVRMVRSYSSDVFYGHLFKSRAQVTVLEGNYFRGTVPRAGESVAESYLVDIPNGGRLVMRNNILVKNKSGTGSNGIMVSYAAEGLTDGRTLGVLIEHNTFVTFAADYDNDGHAVVPMSFFYPARLPGATSFGVPDAVVRHNVFTGFRADSEMQQYNPAGLFRGQNPWVVGFDDLNKDFSLVSPVPSAGSAIVGTPVYRFSSPNAAVRQRDTVGALD